MGQLLDNREDNRYVLGGLVAEVRCILVGAQGCLCFRGPSMGALLCFSLVFGVFYSLDNGTSVVFLVVEKLTLQNGGPSALTPCL